MAAKPASDPPRVSSSISTGATSGPVYSLAAAPSYTYTSAPPAAPAITVNSPVSAPQWPSPIWDPYQVAARPAMFTGTITSTSGQYLLPQPMPRVPYYTQQPVAAAGASQPYVVIPDPGCAAPVVSSAPLSSSAPFVVPPAAAPIPSSTVVMPGATPPAIVAPAAVPMLINPACVPPPVYVPSCYFDADAIFFTRDTRIGNTPLVLLDMNSPTQSNVLLSTADLNFNYEVGPRLLIGHSIRSLQCVRSLVLWHLQLAGHGDGQWQQQF